VSFRPLILAAVFAAQVCWAAEPTASFTRFCASCNVWGADTFTSESGQFIVHGRAGQKSAPRTASAKGAPVIHLEPQLAAVTAERVKRAFLQELGLQDTYSDKVHMVLLDFAPPDQPIEILSKIYSGSFQYEIIMPSSLPEARMMRALVRVLLLDYADRGRNHAAEIPAWLIEGLTRQLESGVNPSYVVNKRPSTVELLGYDRLHRSRAFFQTNAPLTILELSFAERSTPTDRERFEASAHLLVYELLRMQHGRALLASFVQALPSALNWQTAFLAVYREHFHSPLELEKWWMLNWVDVRNRQQHQAWSEPVSLERLDGLLLTRMELRLHASDIPKKADATLQEVLYSTDFGVQKRIINEKLQQIFFLSLNLDPDVLSLAGRYDELLRSYVHKRTLNDLQPGLKSDPEQRLQALLKSTINSLNELDKTRAALRARQKTLASGTPTGR
jgi:hypothetical protein